MRNQKVFDFDEQLKLGDLGERDFIKDYEEGNPTKSKDREYDVLYKNLKIEIKTDSYSMKKTKNFFMEKFSNFTTKDLGGPWRAWQHEIDYFVYYFPKDRTYFWFKPEKLCMFLDSYIKEEYALRIKNKGWTTIGYKIPREILMKVCEWKECFKK